MKADFRVLCIIAVSIIAGIVNAHAAQKGEKTFGVRTGFVSRNTSADAGLFFQYTFSDHFRLQPAVDLVFRHKNRDAFTIDLDAQVPFRFSNTKVDLYPYAGLNYSSWNTHDVMIITPDGTPVDVNKFSDDVSTRTNRFGINLGAGFDFKATETLKLSLSIGYTLVKSHSGLRALVGIGYVF